SEPPGLPTEPRCLSSCWRSWRNSRRHRIFTKMPVCRVMRQILLSPIGCSRSFRTYCPFFEAFVPKPSNWGHIPVCVPKSNSSVHLASRRRQNDLGFADMGVVQSGDKDAAADQVAKKCGANELGYAGHVELIADHPGRKHF